MIGIKYLPKEILDRLDSYGNSTGDVYGQYFGYYNGYYWFTN